PEQDQSNGVRDQEVKLDESPNESNEYRHVVKHKKMYKSTVMSLWVDKYRPSLLSLLDYHKEQASHLQTLVEKGDFPHLLVYGPSGAGKKTRIMCILRELYGNGIEKIHIDHKEFEAPSSKRLVITVLSSNYHLELNPSDVGFYDRVIIQEVIKTIAQTQQLDSAAQRDFKVVILNEVDKLTKDAQHALRRTMEKYTSTCRLILCCESTSKIIPPIRSRCLIVRIPTPTESEIVNIVLDVCKNENVQIPIELAQKIAVKSEGNLRRALLMAETTNMLQYIEQREKYYPNGVLSAAAEIPEPDWEVFIKETAGLMVQEQTPKQLLNVRNRLFELLSHCIPPSLIFRSNKPFENDY
uniref:AAA+ ATPase domain-containing protein n=1 Tax=Romanomermis culicivorax TaxID=13658 RepID=A0A915JX58_ROMCU